MVRGKAQSKAQAPAPASVERLPPTPAVVKKLFAYSGNQCAIPDCRQPLVDPTGTMLGKIAHICAAEPGGTRFNASMTNEERRSFANLVVVCGRHHDVIDDPANVATYTAESLRRYKAAHEGRFKKAERQLLERFVDVTQEAQPTYPTTLKALAAALDVNEIEGHEDEIKGVRSFVLKLKELPLTERDFALKVAERMRRRRASSLPVDDVLGALQISLSALKRHMGLMEHHQLGSIDEGNEHGQYVVSLWSRRPEGNPWVEMIDFCEATGRNPDELVHDLNFGLYDG